MGENLSLKEKAVLSIVVMAIMYLLAGALWFFLQDQTWTQSRTQYHNAQKDHNKKVKLVNQRSRWESDYEAEKVRMPMVDEGVSVDTYWLKILGDVAATNHVNILNPRWDSEQTYGDVKEFPIQCDWEGSLEGLVNFLHAVHVTHGTMMDVRSITIRPIVSHQGYLKGKLSITCAYMRKANEEDE